MLSVIVLTHNEITNLPDLFRSLEPIETEFFVLDSGSTDGTVDLARAHGATVMEHPFDDYGSQRNRAQEMFPIRTDWVLHMDADERLTPELAREIAEVVADPPEDIDGFMLRQRTVFMGRWIRHGGHYPSYHLRLFKAGKGRCENRLYDQHFVVDGTVGRLQHDYIDVVATDLASWSERHIRWAGLEARETLEGGASTGVDPRLRGTPIERRRWMRQNLLMRGPLFLRAGMYWFYRYFLRLGFLDGREGLIFHFLQGFWFRFLVDASIYERRRAAPSASPPPGRSTT